MGPRSAAGDAGSIGPGSWLGGVDLSDTDTSELETEGLGASYTPEVSVTRGGVINRGVVGSVATLSSRSSNSGTGSSE